MLVLDYPLGEESVIESSISVTINGQSSSDWSYHFDTNSVIFSQTNPPEEGDEIEITYAIYGCQDEDSGQ